jgi:pantoate--beta-alanine ligase
VRVATTVAELSEIRDELADQQPRPTVAFVPTMGALHAGHRSLFRIARNVADVVVVSIFVNPLQFGPDEDYARYPRVLDEDLETCRAEDIDVVFVPSVSELYPSGRHVTVSSGALGSSWEGRSRPGHFDGVLTVMAKLFNIVRPDKAIFGQKDAQQVAVVRKMAADLNVDVDVVAAPVVREQDGLALSSRNRYLLPHQRTSALALSAALRAAAEEDNPADALAAARAVIQLAEADGSLTLDYLTLVNPLTFAELPLDHEGDALLLVAGSVGDTRLVDNMELSFPARSELIGHDGSDELLCHDGDTLTRTPGSATVRSADGAAPLLGRSGLRDPDEWGRLDAGLRS